MNMIYPHTDLKFQISAKDFDLGQNKFEVKVRDRFGREFLDMKKKDFIRDSEGNFYFIMENVLAGIYNAYFFGSYEDNDYNKQERVFTDVQELVRVNLIEGIPSSDHPVAYTQVYTVNLDDGEYLVDENGHYILTEDGKKIQFNVQNADETMSNVQLNMTGAQFKHLIEGSEPNSEVNTIPEVMATLQGISDDTTVKRKIDEEVEPKMDGVTQEQFNEIFGTE